MLNSNTVKKNMGGASPVRGQSSASPVKFPPAGNLIGAQSSNAGGGLSPNNVAATANGPPPQANAAAVAAAAAAAAL